MSEDVISLYSEDVCINDMVASMPTGILNGINIQNLNPGNTAVATFEMLPIICEEIVLNEEEEIESIEWIFQLKKKLPQTDETWEDEEIIAEFPYTYFAE